MNGQVLNVNIKNLELIGNAPITLELDAGLYEFLLYQTGNKRMIIESNGYDQTWQIKPKGKHIKTAWIIGFTGLGSLVASGVTSYFAFQKKSDYDSAIREYEQDINDYQWDLKKYETDLEWYNKNPDFFDEPGEKPTYPTSSRPSYDNSFETLSYTLIGAGITAITTGIITWLLNQPSAKQIR